MPSLDAELGFASVCPVSLNDGGLAGWGNKRKLAINWSLAKERVSLIISLAWGVLIIR